MSGIAAEFAVFSTVNIRIKYETNHIILNNHACLQRYFLMAIDLRISGALSCDLKICSIIKAIMNATTRGIEYKICK
jgi:hypothetical protein